MPVAEFVIAVAESVAPLIRTAMAVARALCTEADRTNAGRTMIVRNARGVVSQIVLTVAADITKLAGRAVAIARALGTETRRADTGRTMIVRNAGGVVP